MATITAIKLRRLLNMVPDNTSIYVVGEHGENCTICDVSLHTDDEKQFNKFEIRIDYIIE